MAETPYPWLDPARVQSWAGVESDGAEGNLANLENSRLAVGSWIEDQRPDLFVGTAPAVFTPGERVIQAGVIATARIHSRTGNLAGLVNYGEFAGAVLRNDPDVTMLLGRYRGMPR